MATASSAVRFIGPLTVKPPLTGVIQIHLHVNPGSSNIMRGIVKRVTADRIVLNLAAHARDGAANDAAIAYLALVSRIQRPRFRLRCGHRCRDKTFEVAGIRLEEGPKLAQHILDRFMRASKKKKKKS
ncbi:hypothetical protein L249_7548 [Ophiocordyceps polyrhachis-furcata BCC 54312]|uniref:Uncharacterized protein n=1 Tax=Ophiocordyceps polyrhachis-furcata BCC 54312 TaxID=1330021 RepID=A0A367LAF9_9HYPO|nr:hypothetical protein L249_7548 [Ophiocordyceps polyrhachis-furcata BCC 54312]